MGLIRTQAFCGFELFAFCVNVPNALVYPPPDGHHQPIKSLKKIIKPGGVALFMSVGLALLCSCAEEKGNPADPRLPGTVTMNKDAGRGDLLLLTVHLADGQKLLLVMDTGSPVTALDKSLEPKLGKRLGTGSLENFGATQEAGVYPAPKLYLGNVTLQMTGTNIVTFAPEKLADHDWPLFRGFLGMNVLQNYCVQFDFAAGKVRFLDDKRANKTNWGQPFPLTDIGDGCFSISANLAGVKGLGSVIDSGCDSSGWLRPPFYQQWTNQESATDENVHSPDGILGGNTYHDLDLRQLDAKTLAADDGHVRFNGVGLRALAENLVTLDFPNRTMYLKHTSDWPLPNKDMEAAMTSAQKSSIISLKQLAKRGQLPGASKHDHGSVTTFHFTHQISPYFDTVTWDAQKNGDPSIYHYTFNRTAKHGEWKLQKAWRTDQNGHVEALN